MSYPDTAKLMTVAWEAANSAGEILQENWQEPKTIEYKGAIDLVTSVDRESERKIVAVIRRHASPSPSNTAAELSWDWFTIRSDANASKR
jgi:hypothetical protein